MGFWFLFRGETFLIAVFFSTVSLVLCCTSAFHSGSLGAEFLNGSCTLGFLLGSATLNCVWKTELVLMFFFKVSYRLRVALIFHSLASHWESLHKYFLFIDAEIMSMRKICASCTIHPNFNWHSCLPRHFTNCSLMQSEDTLPKQDKVMHTQT